MAFIDESMKNSSGQTVRVRVPSSQGGSDRTVYINGSNKGYYLGSGNNHVYKNGREIAKNLKDFVENVLGGLILEVVNATSFLLQNKHISYNESIKNK